ncbi:carbohydrate kinase family protein [Patescibacteria group bacterium]|nr:carbohydrate kinase family protein [Patescibacteria group bacterium]MBU1952100.1 carbohydrate kinase family protein [Patescibacteria group bacterium]
MNIYISGSLAYDRIMDFPDYFRNHVLPEKIHILNVSFLINCLKENFGGTAGNIAYTLKLLGDDPKIVGIVGRDFKPYLEWLKKNRISSDNIKIVKSELTAGAYIITDKTNNQITAFHPGAMSHSIGKLPKFGKGSLVIISPGNVSDMVKIAKECKKKEIQYIFDPGQQIPALPTKDLRYLLNGSYMFIVNDYEYALVSKRLKANKSKLMTMTENIIVTRGEKGSITTTNDGSFSINAVKPRKLVDPTGAGDAFRSGLVHGIIKKYPIKRAVQLATLVATYPIERYGTQEHKFTKKEISLRFYKNFRVKIS